MSETTLRVIDGNGYVPSVDSESPDAETVIADLRSSIAELADSMARMERLVDELTGVQE